MKKLFALLAVALGVVACQKDQADFGVNLGGEQEVTINVALSAETRANSALGSLDNGVLATHDLRYILEIYQGDHCLRMEKFTTEDNVAFPVRLAPGRAYNFAVWADFVKKEGARNADDADEYYETSDGLDSIGIIKGTPMDEARDAFYGNAVLGENDKLASLSTIELTRPFAKVRVVATDNEDVRKFGIEPDGATVTYTAQLPTRFDAVNGVASAAQTFPAIDYAIVDNAYSDAEGQLTVFADYIFVPNSGTISFNLDVKDGGVRIKENNFSTAIPVAVNKVTSIVGDVLTDSKDLDININDKFEAETIYLEGDVTLTEDLNVNRPLVVAAGKTAVLNLNGKNIINTNPSENYGEGEGIVVYGNLTIEGEGTIQGTSMAVWARGNDNPTVTINGGNYVGAVGGSQCEVIYASGNGVITINGGTFEAQTEDTESFAAPQYAVLNIHGNGATGCDIVVYGGSFKNFDPANNISENPAKNFCAPGYRSTEVEAGLFVVSDSYVVVSAAGLQAALKEGVEEIRLAANIVGDVTYEQVEGSHVVIDGAGFKYDGSFIINGLSILATDRSLVIKNVNFATEKKSSMNFIGYTSRYPRNITIDNCTFTAPEGDVVAIKLYQAYNVVVKNCTVNGGHSLAQITSSTNVALENNTVNSLRGINLDNSVAEGAVIKNCKVVATKADGYAVRVDNCNATIEGCDLTAYEPVVLRKMGADQVITFAGNTLTAGGEYQIFVNGVKPVMNGAEAYTCNM